jgi:hypothetical protein
MKNEMKNGFKNGEIMKNGLRGLFSENLIFWLFFELICRLIFHEKWNEKWIEKWTKNATVNYTNVVAVPNRVHYISILRTISFIFHHVPFIRQMIFSEGEYGSFRGR